MSLLSVSLILLSFFQGTSIPATETAEHTVRAVEQRFAAALLKKDAVAVDELLADDLLHISFDGQVANKAEYMAFFREGPWQYRKYEPSAMTIKVLGNVAVVTGRVNRTIVINNNETTGTFAFTHVWSRVADRWRLTSSQLTTVPIAPSMQRQYKDS
ncbi:MAG TPA: nuclear transport factor 2 family protein [Pyrinomonadaceae bacterium]|nr:nuclear transport factor 2 family protein [Pyrinomonadaceae bacterium]